MAKREWRGEEIPVILEDCKGFKLIESGAAKYFVDLSEGDENYNVNFRDNLWRSVSETVGHSSARQMGHRYALDFLARNIEKIRNEFDAFELAHDDTQKFFGLLQAHHDYLAKTLASRISKGECEFDDVALIFTKDTEVYWGDGSTLAGGIVQSIEKLFSFTGPFFQVRLQICHGMQGGVNPGYTEIDIRPWNGLKPMSDIPMRRLTKDVKAKLQERGERFRKFGTGAQYASYTGQITQKSWWSSTSYRADGRIMVDARSFARIQSDMFSQIQRWAQVRWEENGKMLEVADTDLWMCSPYLFGFSFRAKQWGMIEVDSVKPIEWREDAFDKLVLPQDDKDTIQSLVKYNGDSFSDLVEGKGGGCIFLLHGEPGQGKTLTAETVAELLHKPLYSVGVGELGTDPTQLEQTLREILDVATVWDAVLLLDEADIFLEARDSEDIVRNAMVGVFLRLLEYHQGVLFLTTNRVENIDRAFYSRISVALRFDGADESKRQQIWTNLLSMTNIGLTKDEIHTLAKSDVNGRQIKNIIRITQTLARAKGTDIKLSDLEAAVDKATRFEREMTSGK